MRKIRLGKSYRKIIKASKRSINAKSVELTLNLKNGGKVKVNRKVTAKFVRHLMFAVRNGGLE